MGFPSCELDIRRVAVLGSPGSGKTAFAHRLAAATGLPLFHLDDFYWHPGWTRTPGDLWQDTVIRLCAGDRWIIDGNYLATVGVRVQAADLVVLFDRHPLLCAVSLIRRSVRLRLRRDTNEYLPRRLRSCGVDSPVRSLRALLRKALVFRRRQLAIMRRLMQVHKSLVITCRSRAAADRLLASLEGLIQAPATDISGRCNCPGQPT